MGLKTGNYVSVNLPHINNTFFSAHGDQMKIFGRLIVLKTDLGIVDKFLVNYSDYSEIKTCWDIVFYCQVRLS